MSESPQRPATACGHRRSDIFARERGRRERDPRGLSRLRAGRPFRSPTAPDTIAPTMNQIPVNAAAATIPRWAGVPRQRTRIVRRPRSPLPTSRGRVAVHRTPPTTRDQQRGVDRHKAQQRRQADSERDSGESDRSPGGSLVHRAVVLDEGGLSGAAHSTPPEAATYTRLDVLRAETQTQHGHEQDDAGGEQCALVNAVCATVAASDERGERRSRRRRSRAAR